MSDALPPPSSRRVRRLLNRFAQVLMLARGEEADAAKRMDIRRPSHEMVCEACGETYLRHAADPFEPWLTVLCSGERVKL